MPETDETFTVVVFRNDIDVASAQVLESIEEIDSSP